MQILGTKVLDTNSAALVDVNILLTSQVISSATGSIIPTGGTVTKSITGVLISSSIGTLLVAATARVTTDWVEYAHNSTDIPTATVTSEWVEYAHNDSNIPNATVTSLWIEHIYKPSSAERISQVYAETISQSNPNASVTQQYSEIISKPLEIDSAVTQTYLEALSERKNLVFSTQSYIETISNNWTSIFPARNTQIYCEIISSSELADRLRVTQEYSEVISATDVSEHVTEVYAEIHRIPQFVDASTTSLFAEVIRRTREVSDIINTNVHM